ncbi:hypothetical protein ACHAW6_003096 [Cyclotella cf. meneghiniana]
MLAVGAPYNAPAGHVRAYNFSGTGWTQLGLDIDGESASDYSGWSVSLSGDGSILAVGAAVAGCVRVYNFNGTGWAQLGLDIDEEVDYDSFGYSVSLSSDGGVLAVGAPLNDPSSGWDAGHVRVYNFNGTAWNQLGLDIDGEATGDQSGTSVSLSGNGNVLAVGAPEHSHYGAGYVRVYNFNGTGWTQLGLDIEGENTGDGSGASVSLSSDGSVLAVGAPGNDPSSGVDAGHVRVYNFNGTGWTQLGLDIDGEAAGDYSGTSVSLSSDGSVLAVGAPNNTPTGHVRVYNFNGTGWTQLGLDIDGKAASDGSGASVSLSEDGSMLAVGAPQNAGHARVYIAPSNHTTTLPNVSQVSALNTCLTYDCMNGKFLPPNFEVDTL